MNLICNAFAFISEYETGRLDVNRNNEDQIKEIYLKNSCVSLISAKRINPEEEVALCTNIELPKWCVDILEKEYIKIFLIPFDCFLFNKDTKWSLAFYKICVLKHLIDTYDFENICLMDCDTIVNKEFGDLWEEAAYGVLMYNTFDTYNHQMRKEIKKEFQRIFPSCDCRNNEYFAGGEITGNKIFIEGLITLCEDIYDIMQKNEGGTTVYGDEFFWYAIDKLKPGLIIPGNGYYEHYWTYKGFRLISTNFFIRKLRSCISL
jgi:hypothetical protein